MAIRSFPQRALIAAAVLAWAGPAGAQGFFDIFAPPPRQSGSEANEPLMSPEQRRTVQRELGARGFYRGPINASLNRETRHAIARWQASVRQNPSGYLTRGQLANLLTPQQPAAAAPEATAPPVAEAPAVPTAPPVAAPPVPAAAAVLPQTTVLTMGSAFWSDQLPARAAIAGQAPAASAVRQATALYAALTATGYAGWVREHPGQPTPGRLIGFLGPLWLGEAQVRRLFVDPVEVQGQPTPLPVPGSGTIAARTSSLVTAIEQLGPEALGRLQQRFDEQYRPLILMQAAKSPLQITSIETVDLGSFDAQAGGYRTPPGEDRIIDEGPTDGTEGWPRIVLATDGPARPPLVPMAEAAPPPRVYLSRRVTAGSVSFAFGGPRLEILVAGRQAPLTLHPDAELQQRLAPAPSRAPVSAATTESGLDVLGLTLGMEMAQAQQILATHMPGHRTVEIAQKEPGEVLFGTARVHVAADNGERIALVTQPDRSGTRIVAIGRHLFGGTDAYDREQLIADLSAKYGGAPLREGALLHWGGQDATAETLCHLMLGSVDLGSWTDASGQPVRWQDFAPADAALQYRGAGPMYWPGLRVPSAQRAADYGGCRPTVAVYIHGNGPRASEFTLWLADPKAYMGLLAAPAAPQPATAAARPKL